MNAKKLFSKEIFNKKLYCWFYYQKPDWYIIPTFSVSSDFPITVCVYFLNFSLQLTYSRG